MKQSFGVPYQGSKNRIAKDIIEVLPAGHRFVDLFAGGCAITHAAFDNNVIGLPHNMLQNLERLNQSQNLTIMDREKNIQTHMVCFNRANNLRSIDAQIEYTEKDYKDYEYREGDVVYCDPPYKGVGGYDNNDFNSDEFYDWVRTREYPIYFSEYSAPEDFVPIFQKQVPMKMAQGQTRTGQRRIERLYIHKKWLQTTCR